MDFLELVTKTRTCRRFRQAEGLPAGTLDWLIECARLAPCAGNAQALRYALAESEAACAAVFPALRWAAALKDWSGPAEGERPTGCIAVLAPKDRNSRHNALDAGLAAQTIQLAAQTRDVGCCIFLSFDPKAVSAALDVPEGYEPVIFLALGLQKEIRVVETSSDAVDYWRDAQAVHHVPKRPASDLIVSRK